MTHKIIKGEAWHDIRGRSHVGRRRSRRGTNVDVRTRWGAEEMVGPVWGPRAQNVKTKGLTANFENKSGLTFYHDKKVKVFNKKRSLKL